MNVTPTLLTQALWSINRGFCCFPGTQSHFSKSLPGVKLALGQVQVQEDLAPIAIAGLWVGPRPQGWAQGLPPDRKSTPAAADSTLSLLPTPGNCLSALHWVGNHSRYHFCLVVLERKGQLEEEPASDRHAYQCLGALPLVCPCPQPPSVLLLWGLINSLSLD